MTFPAAPTATAAELDPLRPPLLDAQGRRMSYLRLSVTDRCNFRCQYCSPASWGGRKDLLTAPELERIVSVFGALGIRRVRLTGGEPLIRPDIVDRGPHRRGCRAWSGWPSPPTRATSRRWRACCARPASPS